MVKRATDVDEYVGRRTRQRRLELGLSQGELAKALGITFQQIQKYENGTNRVSAGRLFNMARHLDVTLDYFFEGLGLPAARKPTLDMSIRHDKQVIALVRKFIQISDDGARAALVGLAGAMAEAPQTKPRKKRRAKRKS